MSGKTVQKVRGLAFKPKDHLLNLHGGRKDQTPTRCPLTFNTIGVCVCVCVCIHEHMCTHIHMCTHKVKINLKINERQLRPDLEMKFENEGHCSEVSD